MRVDPGARHLTPLICAGLLIYPAYVFERWAPALMGVAIFLALISGLMIGRQDSRRQQVYENDQE